MTSNYTFNSRDELLEASDLWRTNPTSAKATYGEMNTWDVSAITDFSRIFSNWVRFNEDISNWDVSNGTNFFLMFSGAPSFNQDLSKWDVSSGTSFMAMFSNAQSFNQDLSAWDVSSGTDFRMMFNGTRLFNQDLNSWDVSNGLKFGSMFSASYFNTSIGDWDVSSGTDFNGMFNINRVFNQDLSSWDVSSGTDFSYMFRGTWALEQDLNSWNIKEDATLTEMFKDSSLMQTNKGFSETPSFSEFNQTLNISGHQVGTSYNLAYIKDYDGNLHANTGSVSDATKTSYKYQGLIDVNADGTKEAIYTNKESGRWVTASINSSTGEIDYSDHGSGGTTRVVGIYIDPLVQEGIVEQFGPHDSQRRFQNDLKIDNLIAKTSGDYDGDGFQEVYWKTNDGTAYLRALMHADGNIQYANYQNEEQMSDYLTSKGYESVISDII
jgi:hypothetical protein